MVSEIYDQTAERTEWLTRIPSPCWATALLPPRGKGGQIFLWFRSVLSNAVTDLPTVTQDGSTF